MEKIQTNPELERLFQSSVEQSMTAQVRVNSDEKVSDLDVFASIRSSDWLKTLGSTSPGPEASPCNNIGAVSKSWSHRLLK